MEVERICGAENVHALIRDTRDSDSRLQRFTDSVEGHVHN